MMRYALLTLALVVPLTIAGISQTLGVGLLFGFAVRFDGPIARSSAFRPMQKF